MLYVAEVQHKGHKVLNLNTLASAQPGLISLPTLRPEPLCYNHVRFHINEILTDANIADAVNIMELC